MNYGLHLRQFPTGHEERGVGEELLPNGASQYLIGIFEQFTRKLVSDFSPIQSGTNALLIEPFRMRLS